MNRELRDMLIIVALVLSAVVHLAVMIKAKPMVMTRVTSGITRAVRHAPMRVIDDAKRPDPVKLDEILDLDAVKSEPEAKSAVGDPATPKFEVQEVADRSVEPKVAASKAELPPPEPVQTTFDAKPISIGLSDAEVKVPMERIEMPGGERGVRPLSAPEPKKDALTQAAPEVPAIASPGIDPSSVFLPVAPIRRENAAEKTFKPADEVYEKVDAKVVEEEKKAVREQLEGSENPEELSEFADVSLAAAERGEWRYFSITLSPKRKLQIVPKDVVILIDGSGSIGNDRFGSCRKAARRILRSATNSGDRFNLVVFRNRYSYAFRSWRPCDATSFAAADKWLSNETAHGRTDVFSTISSVLTLPRDPSRPLIALVVTDGDANEGVSDTAEMISRFTALNDGLVSVYMYGVKSAANRELIDVLTHANRGESFVFDGWRWNAGDGIESLSERFRDPVLSDLRVVFASSSRAEAYPRLLRNLYRGGVTRLYGRMPLSEKKISFAIRGLNGSAALESFYVLPFASAAVDPTVYDSWVAERSIEAKLSK